MFYFVLNFDLEPDVADYAKRHCTSQDAVVYRDEKDHVVAGFLDADRATLFLNLFEGEIEESFDAAARVTAA
jgi:hypothetical protein